MTVITSLFITSPVSVFLSCLSRNLSIHFSCSLMYLCQFD